MFGLATMRPLMEMRMIVANKSFADACAQYSSKESTQLKPVSMVPHLNQKNKKSSMGQKYLQKHPKHQVSPCFTEAYCKVQILHMFLRLSQHLPWIWWNQNWKEMGQVQAMGRRRDCTKFRTPQRVFLSLKTKRQKSSEVIFEAKSPGWKTVGGATHAWELYGG